MLLSISLSENNTCLNQSFVSPEGAHNREHPSNLTIYIALPLLDQDWVLVQLVVVCFVTFHIFRKQFLILHFNFEKFIFKSQITRTYEETTHQSD